MERLHIDPRSWADLSRLLDIALDLPSEERDQWLASLSAENDGLKPQLRDLLARAARVETRDFLNTLPKLEEAAAPHVAEEAGQCIGPYRLVREIGAGGMGSVWLAERIDGLIKRPVALKLPHVASSRAGLAERLAREREILAALAHPNIARLYDAGVTAEGRPYLALEYAEGEAIDEYCRSRRLDVHARLHLFLQVADAVSYAHAKLIIHRDLKPANILVTSRHEVRLLDFGVAKLLDEGEARATRLTELSGRALTPDYASPEQILGQPLTIATDVYSLGVVLYELLAGARPYRLKRESRGALEDAILQSDPGKPSDICAPAERRALRGDLDTIVLKALKKRPGERYVTVNAFMDDLRRHLERRPVLARPDSAWYRAGRFVARRRLIVALAATALLGLILGAGVALSQMLEARKQRDAAISQQQRAETFSEFMALLLQDAGERPLTAPELLDRGREMLERQTSMDDLTAAYMHYEISRNYLPFNEAASELALLERSVELAQRAGDADLLAAAQCSLAGALMSTDRQAAQEKFGEAERTLRALQTRSLYAIADCARVRARLLQAQGDPAGAIAAVKEGLAAFDTQSARSEVRRRQLMTQLTGIYRSRDRFKDALPISADELRFVRASGRAGTMAEIVALNNHAGNLSRVGEVREASALLKEAIDQIERSTHLAIQPVGMRSNYGNGRLRLGDAQGALELAEADLQLAREAGYRDGIALAHLLAARSLLALGRLEESSGRLEAAEEIWNSDPTMFARVLREAALHRVELHAAAHEVDAARTLVDAALAAAGYPESKSAPGIDRVLRSAAKVYLLSGDSARAVQFASEALTSARKLARSEERSADVGLAALLRAQAYTGQGLIEQAAPDAKLAAKALENGYGPAHAETLAARALYSSLQARAAHGPDTL